MAFVRVSPDDQSLVTQVAHLLEAARLVDDPDAFPVSASMLAGQMRYGWDLEPSEHYLYVPDGSDEAIGVLELEMPERDNRHLVWADVTIHPQHRRRGHGRLIMDEVRCRAVPSGRNTIWVGAAEDDLGIRAFIEGCGFRYASHDARRRQLLADVDHDEVARLADQAEAAATDYRLERLLPPISDETLQQLIEVTAAINDAPMGELTYEDEKFDLQRLRDIEAARAGLGSRPYRIVARHRETGEIGGHTELRVHPEQPELGRQGDTAVARGHRGHRLGLLLKIDMMRWLAGVEPQVSVIETWNNVDNSFMINVNEALGYRLSRVFATFERRL
jgi:GNAT superfamily N-acetyltransferase